MAIEGLLNPKSIAIVGASEKVGPGFNAWQALKHIGFQGGQHLQHLGVRLEGLLQTCVNTVVQPTQRLRLPSALPQTVSHLQSLEGRHLGPKFIQAITL